MKTAERIRKVIYLNDKIPLLKSKLRDPNVISPLIFRTFNRTNEYQSSIRYKLENIRYEILKLLNLNDGYVESPLLIKRKNGSSYQRSNDGYVESPLLIERKNGSSYQRSYVEDNTVHIYTDGSWNNIEKDMGIGIAAQYKHHIIIHSAHIGKGTVNIAELTAIEVALEKLKKYSDKPFKIYTDSQYCIGVLSMNWKAKKNIELITRIKDLISEFDNVEFIKVKGHSDNLMNNLVDKLAVDARKNQNKAKVLVDNDRYIR